MNYTEQLKDPRWQKKRLEIMERDDFMCVLCMDDRSTLHVHHKQYIKGKAPWDYEDRYLITLCDKCHDKEHNNLGVKKRMSVQERMNIALADFWATRELISKKHEASFTESCFMDWCDENRHKWPEKEKLASLSFMAFRDKYYPI